MEAGIEQVELRALTPPLDRHCGRRGKQRRRTGDESAPARLVTRQPRSLEQHDLEPALGEHERRAPPSGPRTHNGDVEHGDP